MKEGLKSEALTGVLRGLIENLDSPYVKAPLTLCILFLIAFIPTAAPLCLYAGLGFGILTLCADWIARKRNRQIPNPHFTNEDLEQAVREYLEGIISKSNSLREGGKGAAADKVIDEGLRSIYRELARLADEYEEMRATKPSGWHRTHELECLVWQMRRVTLYAALQALQPNTYLQSNNIGKRVVGLAILEVVPNPLFYDDVLEILINPRSAFEQYHALVAMEQMLAYLESDKRERLQVALTDLMKPGEGRWIKEGTDRQIIASRILNEIQDSSSV